MSEVFQGNKVFSADLHSCTLHVSLTDWQDDELHWYLIWKCLFIQLQMACVSVCPDGLSLCKRTLSLPPCNVSLVGRSVHRRDRWCAGRRMHKRNVDFIRERVSRRHGVREHRPSAVFILPCRLGVIDRPDETLTERCKRGTKCCALSTGTRGKHSILTAWIAWTCILN